MEFKSKAIAKVEHSEHCLRRRLDERDQEIASLKKQLNWAFSVVSIQEKLAANASTTAKLGEEVEAINSAAADTVSAFPYREVMAQTERIASEIKHSARSFEEINDRILLSDIVMGACGRASPFKWLSDLHGLHPDQVAETVEQAREIKALQEQIDRLKTD